jgi:hypothetical protein
LLAVLSDTWLSSEAAQVQVWDVVSRTRLAKFAAPASAGALEFVDGDTLLVADWNGVVWQQSVADGRIWGQSRISKDLVSAASFSSDTRALKIALPATSVVPL